MAPLDFKQHLSDLMAEQDVSPGWKSRPISPDTNGHSLNGLADRPAQVPHMRAGKSGKQFVDMSLSLSSRYQLCPTLADVHLHTS